MMNRLWMLGLLLVAVVAFASTETAVIPAHGQSLRMPVGLDSPQPDSLAYDNMTPRYLSQATNYWSGTRFTVAADFKLKSVYFALLNDANNTTAPCSVFVYRDTVVAGTHRPSTPVPNMWVSIPAPLPSITWIDQDFPDSTEFLAGSSFWIIYGPAPGGDYQTSIGWWNIQDSNGNTDNRSITKTGGRITWTAGISNCAGDLILRAGGRFFSDLIDIKVDSVYSVRGTSNLRRFYHPYGASVGFSTIIVNSGFNPVQNFPVQFTLVDTTSGDTLFRETVTVPGVLAPDASVTVSTTNRWTTPSRVVNATLEVHALLVTDDEPSNDIMLFEQKVDNLNSWYRYDDGELNSSISFNDDRLGVLFIPSRYPARLDSISAYIGGGTNARLDTIEAYLTTDLTTFPANPDWSGTVNVVGTASRDYSVATGGLNIFSGGVLCVVKIPSGHVLSFDNTLPKAAGNFSMPTVTWDYGTSGFQAGESGDWLIRGYIAHTDELPPYPILRTEPVPGDTLLFDTTAVNQPTTRTFKVYNDGGVPLVVSRIWVTTAQRPYVTFNNDTAFTVAALDSHFVTVTWTPSNQGTLNTIMQFTSNTTPATISYRVRGYANAAAAPEPNAIPSDFSLAQNFPNPFNPSTEISFALPRAAKVKLTVMDVMGREVATLANGHFGAGTHQIKFDGSQLSSGVYFYRIEAGSFQAMRKMMLIK